jgi:hypothetical protein
MIITQNPQTYSPAYNELIYVVHSDNHALANYKYICDIYAADGTTRLARIKRIPQPDGYGVFDLHRILENYLSYDINASATGFTSNAKSFCGYIVKMGEEYGTDPLQYLDLATDTKRYVFNGIFDFPDFINYLQDDWLIASGTQKSFLTNAPRTQDVRPDTNAWLHFMTDTDVVYQLVLKTYDASGALLSTWSLLNPLTDITVDANHFLRVPAGPANAGTAFGATLDSGIHHYTLHLEDSSANAISETFTYTINTDPTKYTWYRLHFLNKMGGFDSFDFRQMSRATLDILRTLYRKHTGYEVAGAWGYDAEARGDTQYDTEVKEKLLINSDWISDTEAAWLEELLTSPAVYLERADRSLLAINLETNTYEIKQKANDKLINIQLAFSYAFDKYRQRG